MQKEDLFIYEVIERQESELVGLLPEEQRNETIRLTE